MRTFLYGLALVFGALALGPSQQTVSESPMVLPNKPDSLKFAVLGDFGTGGRAQYELAGQMAALRGRFRFDRVITVGGNIYGSERPRDFLEKFETPYKPLLAAGVTFHAALGEEDSREQRYYKLFNMNGRLHYTFSPKPNVQFFALDAGSPSPDQTQWLEQQLRDSTSAWKIAFFHSPLYSSGDRADARLRAALEPLFVKYNVSVVLTGRDHFYERTKPQSGIVYFVVGSGGKLRQANRAEGSGLTAKRFGADHAFMAAEIAGDEMFFIAVSRQGQTVDSGVLGRRH